jgi:hypothetical protein
MKFLRSFPFYIAILPVFFVLHGYIQHFGFISASDAGSLAIRYIAFTGVVFLCSWLVFKNYNKAGIITLAWVGVYLFFGAMHDFLREHSPFKFLYRYRFIFPFLLFCFVSLFIFLKKSNKDFVRLTVFLNILFCIYLLTDVVEVIWKDRNRPLNKISNYGFAKSNSLIFPDSVPRRDIFFLLFDEYASTASLKERFNYSNDIDSFLMSRGFSVQENSISNYNYTPFSMASTLNMSYLEWLNPENGVNRDDFLRCNPDILKNEIIKILGTNGYDIVNLSVFDIAGHPSLLKQSFLPVKSKMIAEGTLLPRLYNDFEWIFINNRFLSKLMGKEYFFQHIENNELVFREVTRESLLLQEKPRFIYAHFYMPHEPFFFDKNGNRKDNETVIKEYKERSAPAYLEYLQYANSKIEKLIDDLLKNTNRKATILVLSDHGFRHGTAPTVPLWHFQNLNAVYFADQNYSLLYDSISNVNQFRVVINSLFKQKIPLLRDSIVYLKDKVGTINPQ